MSRPSVTFCANCIEERELFEVTLPAPDGRTFRLCRDCRYGVVRSGKLPVLPTRQQSEFSKSTYLPNLDEQERRIRGQKPASTRMEWDAADRAQKIDGRGPARGWSTKRDPR